MLLIVSHIHLHVTFLFAKVQHVCLKSEVLHSRLSQTQHCVANLSEACELTAVANQLCGRRGCVSRRSRTQPFQRHVPTASSISPLRREPPQLLKKH